MGEAASGSKFAVAVGFLAHLREAPGAVITRLVEKLIKAYLPPLNYQEKKEKRTGGGVYLRGGGV